MCLGNFVCSVMSGMFPGFNRCCGVSDLIYFGQEIGQSMQKIVCMHAGLSAWLTICAPAGLACSDSIDTLISLIQPNLAEIWA